MSEHTKKEKEGKLRVIATETLDNLVDENGTVIAQWIEYNNALRLVATWDACDGIPTEDINDLMTMHSIETKLLIKRNNELQKKLDIILKSSSKDLTLLLDTTEAFHESEKSRVELLKALKTIVKVDFKSIMRRVASAAVLSAEEGK